MADSRPRRRWWVRLLRWTGIALVLLVLLVVGLVLSLRSSAVRQAVLGRVTALVERELGVAVTVEDFSLGLRKERFDLTGVTAGAPGRPPVAQVERVRIEVALRSLFGPAPVFREVELVRPVIDLAAPFPTLRERPPAQGGGGEVTVERFAVTDAEVIGPPPSGALGKRVSAWRAHGISLEGSFRRSTLEAQLTAARAVVTRPGFAPLDLSARGRLRWKDGEPLRFSDVEVTGDGVSLAASGEVGLSGGPLAGRPLAVDFEVAVEPYLLAAETPRGGLLRAAGRLALPEESGTVKVTAEAVPAEALRVVLDEATFNDLALAETVVEGEARATVGPGSLFVVKGSGEAAWRKGRRSLGRGRLEVAAATGSVRIEVEGSLLPGSPGRREVSAVLTAASWTELPAGRIADGRAELRVPDLPAAYAEVKSLWPRLVPPLPEEVPLQGELTASARFSGAVRSPQATLDARWIPVAGSVARLTAEGRPLEKTGEAFLGLEKVPLDLARPLAGEIEGTVSGTVDVASAGRADGKYRTTVRLTVQGLRHAEATAGTASLSADGTLGLAPLRFAGTVGASGVDLSSPAGGSGPVHVADFDLAAEGTLALDPPRFSGQASGFARGLEVPGTVCAERIDFFAEGEAGADLDAITGRAVLVADRLVLTETGEEVRNLEAEVATAGDRIQLTHLRATLPPERGVEISGEVSRKPFLAEASLRVVLERPVTAVERAELWAELEDGVVKLWTTEVATATGPVELEATVPLGALAAIPEVGDAMKALPVEQAPGPVSVVFRVQSLDAQAVLAALEGPERPERPEQVTGSLRAELTFEPTAPAAGRGEVVLEDLAVTTPDGTVEGVGPLTARLGEGRLEIAPVRLRLAGAGLAPTEVEAQGVARLDPAWNPFRDPPKSLVRDLEGKLAGTVEASLLNPYLAGGSAEGPLRLEASAKGSLETLDASLRMHGPEAAFVWPSPYVTRVAAPEAVVVVRDGRLTIEKGEARVNGGTLTLAGGASLEGDVDVEATFSDLRFRVDYGMAALVGGQLRFTLPSEGRALLSGRVSLDRGVLSNDINLDREVLELLLAPPATPGTQQTFLDTVDLDLTVTTRDGVRIRNNVGDLRAAWQPLEVSGTLAVPVIRGSVELDPGGLFFAYGQTLRIDQGALVFTGDPLTDPQVELTAVSSLEDPSISALPGTSPDPLAALQQQEKEEELRRRRDQGIQEPTLGESVALGLGGYYSGRMLTTVAEALGVSGLSQRPIEIFGEVDPSTRLTVSKDLSSLVAVAVSQDLRNAEDRYYVLDLHGIPRFRRFGAQVFTKQNSDQGASVQQVFELGGPKETGPPAARLASLTFQAPPELSARSLRRMASAAGLRRGAPVPDVFEVEVDLGVALRRRGYPDAEVVMTSRPSTERPGRLDVTLAVEPGPHVTFDFAGNRIPRTARDEIRGLYRADFYEPTALDEMKAAAVRSFRRHGHLDPEVEIAVERADPADPASDRNVTIRSVAGPKVKIQQMTVAGIPDVDSVVVAGRFPGTLARVELAAGLAAADRRLLDELRTLGWPEAEVLGHGVSDRGRHLVVRVEPGPRQRIGTVKIEGVEGEERAKLAGKVLIKEGDPARYPLVAGGATAMEEDLRARGFAEARVRGVPAATDDAQVVDVTYEVKAGARFAVADVAFEGERYSREPVLAKVAGLEEDAVYTAAEVSRARSRLFRTGVFSRVLTDVARDDARGEALVTFSLFERPRYRVGYGVRWTSDEGAGAVVDFADQNFLRRGLTFGARALYEANDQSGRLYLQARGILGSAYSMESFVLVRRQISEEIFVEDRREAALQVSRPFGTRITSRLYARYQESHFFEREPDPFFPLDLTITNPHLGTQMIYDSRDDGVDPRRGTLASADLSGSGPWLGGDFDYARFFGQLATYRNLTVGGADVGWAGSVRLGLAEPFGGQELLRTERFFTGGELTVRGYPTDDLGPQEVLGDLVRPLGGEALLVINQELRVRLPFDLTGVAFFDAGQVWADSGDFGTDLAKSLGLGLRASTPFGLVRFDAAYPLDRRPGDERYRLYVGLGNAF